MAAQCAGGRCVAWNKSKSSRDADADAALKAIGGTDGPSLLARAREVEFAIYKISAALMPPDLQDIDSDAAAAYRPFDVIEFIPYHRRRGTMSVAASRDLR